MEDIASLQFSLNLALEKTTNLIEMKIILLLFFFNCIAIYVQAKKGPVKNSKIDNYDAETTIETELPDSEMVSKLD